MNILLFRYWLILFFDRCSVYFFGIVNVERSIWVLDLLGGSAYTDTVIQCFLYRHCRFELQAPPTSFHLGGSHGHHILYSVVRSQQVWKCLASVFDILKRWRKKGEFRKWKEVECSILPACRRGCWEEVYIFIISKVRHKKPYAYGVHLFMSR